MARKITGYTASSVIAAITAELAFAASFGLAHTGTTVATAVGFAGGAIPNYFLNRRWAWKNHNGRDKRTEVTLYIFVSIVTFAASAVATKLTVLWAKTWTASHGWQTVLGAAAYFAVSGLFFAIKFVIYELWVFKKHPDQKILKAGGPLEEAATSKPDPLGESTASGW